MPLENELLQFYSDIYDALKIIDTQGEKDAIAKLALVKPKLVQEAESLSGKLSKIPDLNEAEEDAWVQRLMENRVIQDMMNLMNNL